MLPKSTASIKRRGGADLLPMFSYYGSKWRLVPFYPPPKHNLIVEPFAGSASYALRYANRKVLLYDVNPKVVGLWRYLIAAKPSEILALPLKFRRVNDLTHLCEEARWLIGWWIAKGSQHPRNKPSPWMHLKTRVDCVWGSVIRARIASQVNQIKHWRVCEGSYEECPNQAATWLIDPPYQSQGVYYVHHEIDYKQLAAWCRARKGQVIVCGTIKDTWLPFQHLKQVSRCASNVDKGKEMNYCERVWVKN